MNKTLAYYQGLPYSRRVEGVEEDGGIVWLAWIEELPGCKTDGKTIQEAASNLNEAFDDYIEAMLAFESDIPEPRPLELPPSPDLIAIPLRVKESGSQSTPAFEPATASPARTEDLSLPAATGVAQDIPTVTQKRESQERHFEMAT